MSALYLPVSKAWVAVFRLFCPSNNGRANSQMCGKKLFLSGKRCAWKILTSGPKFQTTSGQGNIEIWLVAGNGLHMFAFLSQFSGWPTSYFPFLCCVREALLWPNRGFRRWIWRYKPMQPVDAAAQQDATRQECIVLLYTISRCGFRRLRKILRLVGCQHLFFLSTALNAKWDKLGCRMFFATCTKDECKQRQTFLNAKQAVASVAPFFLSYWRLEMIRNPSSTSNALQWPQNYYTPHRYFLQLLEPGFGEQASRTCDFNVSGRDLKRISNCIWAWLPGVSEAFAPGLERFDHTLRHVVIVCHYWRRSKRFLKGLQEAAS